MQRHGQIVRTKQGYAERYIELHANVWPEVLAAIKRSNINNYSIYYKDDWLFTYFEYSGQDFNYDMDKLLSEPVMIKWLKVCEPCMQPLDDAPDGVCEMEMQRVFFLD